MDDLLGSARDVRSGGALRPRGRRWPGLRRSRRRDAGADRAREPRTVIYACHRVEGAPDSRIFYELYEDRAAFDEHESGEHVKRFLAEREQYLAGSPRVEFLELPGRFQPAVVGAAEGSHG